MFFSHVENQKVYYGYLDCSVKDKTKKPVEGFRLKILHSKTLEQIRLYLRSVSKASPHCSPAPLPRFCRGWFCVSSCRYVNVINKHSAHRLPVPRLVPGPTLPHGIDCIEPPPPLPSAAPRTRTCSVPADPLPRPQLMENDENKTKSNKGKARFLLLCSGNCQFLWLN